MLVEVAQTCCTDGAGFGRFFLCRARQGYCWQYQRSRQRYLNPFENAQEARCRSCRGTSDYSLICRELCFGSLFCDVDIVGKVKDSANELLSQVFRARPCSEERWNCQVMGEDDISAILERAQEQSFGCNLPSHFVVAPDKTPALPGRPRKAAAANSDSSSEPETGSQTDNEEEEEGVSSGP